MAGQPTLLAQLSDPHVEVGRGDRASAFALAAAVRCVAALRPRPHAALVSGDLVNNPGAREYERVRELLAPLRMPVYVLAGNHDDRDALREYFALSDGAGAVAPEAGPGGGSGSAEGPATLAGGAGAPAGSVDLPAGAEGVAGPVEAAGPAAVLPGSTGGVGEPFQYATEIGGLRLIGCDTTLPGREEGAYDARRRAWLEAQLAADPAIPTIVAMHHAPLRTGHHAFDSIGLAEPDRLALGELLERSAQVRRVVGGHFHRAIFDTLGGRGVIACPSTYLQVPLEIGGEEIHLVAEAPAFMLHALLDPGELVSHLQPVPG